MPEDGDMLAILDVIGLRVVMIEGLGRDAALYLGDGVLLIDASMTDERLDSIADQALAAAAAAIRL